LRKTWSTGDQTSSTRGKNLSSRQPKPIRKKRQLCAGSIRRAHFSSLSKVVSCPYGQKPLVPGLPYLEAFIGSSRIGALPLTDMPINLLPFDRPFRRHLGSG
jgi:hypothetical protein